jgi:hypothetical protein
LLPLAANTDQAIDEGIRPVQELLSLPDEFYPSKRRRIVILAGDMEWILTPAETNGHSCMLDPPSLADMGRVLTIARKHSHRFAQRQG